MGCTAVVARETHEACASSESNRRRGVSRVVRKAYGLVLLTIALAVTIVPTALAEETGSELKGAEDVNPILVPSRPTGRERLGGKTLADDGG